MKISFRIRTSSSAAGLHCQLKAKQSRSVRETWVLNQPEASLQLLHDGKRDRFESGDLLFVAAGIEHQIEEISENFAMWRVFYGPHGGEVPA